MSAVETPAGRRMRGVAAPDATGLIVWLRSGERIDAQVWRNDSVARIQTYVETPVFDTTNIDHVETVGAAPVTATCGPPSPPTKDAAP